MSAFQWAVEPRSQAPIAFDATWDKALNAAARATGRLLANDTPLIPELATRRDVAKKVARKSGWAAQTA